MWQHWVSQYWTLELVRLAHPVIGAFDLHSPSHMRIWPCKTPGIEKQSLVPKDGKGKELSNTCHSSPLLHHERSRSFSLGSNRGERRQECCTILAFPTQKEIPLVGSIPPWVIVVWWVLGYYKKMQTQDILMICKSFSSFTELWRHALKTVCVVVQSMVFKSVSSRDAHWNMRCDQKIWWLFKQKKYVL